MPVIYGNTQIRPAPEVVIEKRFEEFGDGRKMGVALTATLKGTITTTKTDDTVNVVAMESRLAVTLQKQQALRAIFANDGQYFEVQGFDGSQSTKFLARVKSIDFDEGRWIDICNYTVVLEGIEFAAEILSSENMVESATESWSFEDADVPHVYRVSHSLSAKGKTSYEADGQLLTLAWQRAKDFVTSKLKLGWTDTDSILSPLSGQEIWQQSENYDATATNVYNRVLQESQDEVNGTYSVVETFTLANNDYTEKLHVSVRRVVDQPLTTCIINMTGTITGLFVNLHDYESKLANAKTRWAAVQPLLFSMASSYAPTGVTLNSKATQGGFDTDSNEGIITYNYEFSDRKLVNDTLETYTLDKKISQQSPFVTVTINGTIQGMLYPGENDYTLKYQRALAQWNIVKLVLYSRCLGQSSALVAYPIDSSVTYDQINGSVAYSQTYDSRPYLSVIDDYTVSKSYTRETGRTDITVSGTITGLYTTLTNGEPNPASYKERFNNAQAYWNTVKDNLLGRASSVGVTYTEINPTPYSQEYSFNDYQGTVAYQFTWNNIPAPCVPGSLSEIISVVDSAAIPTIAIIPVLGRSSGPVVQNLQTPEIKRRSITFEVVMPVNFTDTTGLICSGRFLAPQIDYTAYIPVGTDVYQTQNQQSWSPSTGRLTLQLEYVFN